MVYHEKTTKSRKVYEGNIITLRLDHIRTKQGGESLREIVEHPGGVAIVALTDDHKVILVKQFRKPAEDVLLEIPAGKIEKGEDPEHTAVRELKEETGYTASEMEHLMTFYSSPGFSTEKIYLYLAKNLVPGEPSPDENEHVEVMSYPLDELFQMIDQGELIDGKSITGIQALQRKLNI